MTIDNSNLSSNQKPSLQTGAFFLDIDLDLNNITRPNETFSNCAIVNIPQISPKYSILHGLGKVANALSVGDMAESFNRFQVDVAALAQPEDNYNLPKLHRTTRMIWNEVDIHSPRLEIYVQGRMLRHLVELYVTKRMNFVIMSMKIIVDQQSIVDKKADSEVLPLLNNDGHLYFRRTQCELLSVHAAFSH
jgi:hypothetical protein